MYIQLDPEAKSWIEAKGANLTIKTLVVNSCCAPGIQELVAIPGKPKTINHFNQFNAEGISIFIHKNISQTEKLTIKVSGFGPFKSISANFNKK